MHRSHRTLTAGPVFVALILAAVPAAALDAELWGLSLGVADVPRAVSFYRNALHFDVVTSDPLAARLKLGDLHVLLHRSTRRPAPWAAPRAYLNLTVDDLDATLRRVVAEGGGVHPGGPFESAVGAGFTVQDPDGNPLDLIDHPWDDDQANDAPPVRLFNVGLHVIDKERYEPFFAALGIGVRTRDYLPRTLVLEQRGAAQIVLHDATETAAADEDRGTLLFVAGAPLAADSAPGLVRAEAGLRHAWLELRSPSGIPVRLYERLPEGLAGAP